MIITVVLDGLKDVFRKKVDNEDIQTKNAYREYYLDLKKNSKNDCLEENRGYFSFAHNGYIKNPIAFRAVNIIAHAVSDVELTLIENKDGHCYDVYKHELKKLIAKPNPFSTTQSFIEKIVYNLLIGGGVFILIVRNVSNVIKELYVLNQNEVTVLTDRTNSFVVGYQYSNGLKTQEYKINATTGECDILHIKNFHPLNDIYGLSPFEAAAAVIDQHNLAIQWNKNLMKNNARPSGAIIVDQPKGSMLTITQRNALKAEIESLYSDASSLGKPILLEGGLKWQEMGISPRDLDFSEANNIAVRHIANVFGVPIQLLNDSTSTSYNNYLEAKRALYENTVLPLLNKIITFTFNNWLCSFFDKNLTVKYKEENIPALSYKYEQKLKNLHESNFLTINEKRKIMGFEPIEGGDKLDVKC